MGLFKMLFEYLDEKDREKTIKKYKGKRLPLRYRELEWYLSEEAMRMYETDYKPNYEEMKYYESEKGLNQIQMANLEQGMPPKLFPSVMFVYYLYKMYHITGTDMWGCKIAYLTVHKKKPLSYYEALMKEKNPIIHFLDRITLKFPAFTYQFNRPFMMMILDYIVHCYDHGIDASGENWLYTNIYFYPSGSLKPDELILNDICNLCEHKECLYLEE